MARRPSWSSLRRPCFWTVIFQSWRGRSQNPDIECRRRLFPPSPSRFDPWPGDATRDSPRQTARRSRQTLAKLDGAARTDHVLMAKLQQRHSLEVLGATPPRSAGAGHSARHEGARGRGGTTPGRTTCPRDSSGTLDQGLCFDRLGRRWRPPPSPLLLPSKPAQAPACGVATGRPRAAT
jgi:hypothetical protein